jgi:hypothetical protein
MERIAYFESFLLLTLAALYTPKLLCSHGQLIFSWIARWFFFKPKIPIWVNFGGLQIGKCLYILWPFETFFEIWNIL